MTNLGHLIGFAYAAKGTTTVDDFKAFLDANEVYVWTSLATPVETALSAAEIAAYKALTTYAPTTVISVTDGAGATATYQRDVNLVIKNLEDQLLRISDSKRSILMNRRAAPERAPCFHMPLQKGGGVNVHCVIPVPDALYLKRHKER